MRKRKRVGCTVLFSRIISLRQHIIWLELFGVTMARWKTQFTFYFNWFINYSIDKERCYLGEWEKRYFLLIVALKCYSILKVFTQSLFITIVVSQTPPFLAVPRTESSSRCYYGWYFTAISSIPPHILMNAQYIKRAAYVKEFVNLLQGLNWFVEAVLIFPPFPSGKLTA